MHGDDESRRFARGAADGQPLAGGELLRAVEEDEAGSLDLAELVREPVFFLHAALGLQAEEDRLKTARRELGDQLFEQRGFPRAVPADDARAPVLGLDFFQQYLPIHARWKTEWDGFQMGGGKWIVARGHHGAEGRGLQLIGKSPERGNITAPPMREGGRGLFKCMRWNYASRRITARQRRDQLPVF